MAEHDVRKAAAGQLVDRRYRYCTFGMSVDGRGPTAMLSVDESAVRHPPRPSVLVRRRRHRAKCRTWTRAEPSGESATTADRSPGFYPDLFMVGKPTLTAPGVTLVYNGPKWHGMT